MARILLTGGRAPATLELARLFLRRGHEVEVAESWGIYACRFSRAARRHWPLPPPRQAFVAFSEALQQLVSQRRYDLLIPTCEEVFWVARAKPLLEAYVHVLCPPLAELRELHDKHAFSELIGRCGLPGPDTTLLHSPEAVRRYAAGAPASVYKPSFSRFGTQTLIRPSWATLSRLRPTPEQPWSAQPYKAGQEWCAYAVLQTGRVAALAVYPSQIRIGGASVYFQAARHAGIERWIEQFGHATQLSGQLAFDFKEDADGLWALECNPRLTSGIHLFRDQPEVSEVYLGQSSAKPLHAQPTTALALKTAMVLGGKLRSAPEWRAWAAARDVMYAPHDKLPALAQPLLGASLALRAARLRVGLLAATTHDIEWNGEA
ncbi:hypothetical protein E7T06_07515 [Deinococcus sp. Arct2-2]|uniref:hypothetical protein n=1 Tax=Deinococcus sp. Arct2-2 TaxID=2568653 RepID=UPI0010A50891|nr:hypothetical protein [Deinococcus sp. Arct2-2]THF70314.1 hypothetical protein E7T06_07515 [Deinococcus sp. Arct2-2]